MEQKVTAKQLLDIEFNKEVDAKFPVFRMPRMVREKDNQEELSKIGEEPLDFSGASDEPLHAYGNER